MATRKSGPVKPPTIDLEASKKADTAAASKASASKAGAHSSSAASKSRRALPSINWALPIAAGGGAIAGALLAYLIAATGLWPTKAPQAESSAPAIAALERRLEAIETSDRTNATDFTALETRLADIQTDTRTQLDTANNAVEQLHRNLENLPAPTGDNSAALSQIETQQQQLQLDLQTSIDTLNTRIEALAAGADPDAATKIADTINATNQALAATRQSVSALETTTKQQLVALSVRLKTAETNLVARATIDSATSQTMRLPLALSGMEAALNRGRPFATELSALSASLTAITISPALQSAADAGLPTPETIARDFTATIPQILAAAPQNPDASWQDNLLNQAKSLLALRPTGAVTGNSPEALVARTEAALAIPDFATASQTLAAMPADMRTAAGDVVGAISAQAEARQLLLNLRAAALAEGAAQ